MASDRDSRTTAVRLEVCINPSRNSAIQVDTSHMQSNHTLEVVLIEPRDGEEQARDLAHHRGRRQTGAAQVVQPGTTRNNSSQEATGRLTVAVVDTTAGGVDGKFEGSIASSPDVPDNVPFGADHDRIPFDMQADGTHRSSRPSMTRPTGTASQIEVSTTAGGGGGSSSAEILERYLVEQTPEIPQSPSPRPPSSPSCTTSSRTLGRSDAEIVQGTTDQHDSPTYAEHRSHILGRSRHSSFAASSDHSSHPYRRRSDEVVIYRDVAQTQFVQTLTTSARFASRTDLLADDFVTSEHIATEEGLDEIVDGDLGSRANF